MNVRFRPELVHSSAWIAPGATVTADVQLAENSSVWFGAVLRGDVEPVRLGAGSNVQDLSCLHTDVGYPCLIGQRVTIGHRAVVHGAVVEEESLIGMGAIVLTGAVIGKHSIVAAGCLVPEGMQIPTGSLVMGVPAKIVRTVTAQEIHRICSGAARYMEYARIYRTQE
jgi:carbonic anhydrase/acetyltransferase-like protein (isoleucine patch superfamily)